MNAVGQLMAERINYGGVCGTRAQVYAHALKACLSRLGPDEPNRRRRAELAADHFACGRHAKALTEAEAARLMPWEQFLGIESGEMME